MTVNAALSSSAGRRGLAVLVSGVVACGTTFAPAPAQAAAEQLPHRAAAGQPPLGALAAPGPVPLGAAERFAVLAGRTVTSTGASVIDGDVGVAPGEALSGFPPAVLNGARHTNDEPATKAQTDLTRAYEDASNRVSTDPTGTELGGKTLGPGVYTSTDAVALTGTLVLDARGDANAAFVFQLATTLVTSADSRVQVVNSPGPACGVLWKVGTSATLGSGSEFVGTVMALDSISLNTGARVVPGAVLARDGAVTLDDSTVNRTSCLAGAPGSPAPGQSPSLSPSASPSASPSPSSPGPTPTTPSPSSPSPSPSTPSPSSQTPSSQTPSAPSAPPAPTSAPSAPAPVEPAQPVQPPMPAQPVEPPAPAQPVEPVEPPAPVEPAAPAVPVQPEQPALPVQPDVPNLPVPQNPNG